MNAVCNREAFTDPRPATQAELLKQADHRAIAAKLRMRAAIQDMDAAKIDLLRGDDDAHNALAMAVLSYKAEYRRCLQARQDEAQLLLGGAR
ncbi:hypothetical protein [Arenimonas alkanexedens]